MHYQEIFFFKIKINQEKKIFKYKVNKKRSKIMKNDEFSFKFFLMHLNSTTKKSPAWKGNYFNLNKINFNNL